MSSFASRSHRAGQVGVQECTPSMAIRKATKEFQGACSWADLPLLFKN